MFPKARFEVIFRTQKVEAKNLWMHSLQSWDVDFMPNSSLLFISPFLFSFTISASPLYFLSLVSTFSPSLCCSLSPLFSFLFIFLPNGNSNEFFLQPNSVLTYSPIVFWHRAWWIGKIENFQHQMLVLLDWFTTYMSSYYGVVLLISYQPPH